MIIKRKSLIVAVVSSIIISLVLILTLIGYLAYLTLREENLKLTYQDLLAKVNAKAYSRYIEFSALEAKMEVSGVLKAKPTVSGTIKNKGTKNITSLLVKAKFLDKDGATIYETAFLPQQPSLSASALKQVNIPYLRTSPKVILKSGDSLAFKIVIADCPREIFLALKETASPGKTAGRWAGKVVCELLEIDF